LPSRFETSDLTRFWNLYRQLPGDVQKLADKNYQLLKVNPSHPSLQFKKVGKHKQLWSVRVGINYRALGTEKSEGVVWFWIGTHAQYDKLLS